MLISKKSFSYIVLIKYQNVYVALHFYEVQYFLNSKQLIKITIDPLPCFLATNENDYYDKLN